MPLSIRAAHLRNVGVALGLALAFHFILDAVYRYLGGYIVQLAFDIGKSLTLDEATLRTFVLTASHACDAAILGVLFGVPLALLVSRNVIAYWLLFVVAVIAMHFLRIVWTKSEVGWLIAEWIFPIAWLNMLAILGVALVTSRYRRPLGNLAPNAP